VEIRSLSVGPLQTNAYLAWRDPSSAALIDPGYEAERILDWVGENAVTIRAILLTHAHFDHVGALAAVQGELGAPVWLHPLALPVYRRAAESASRWALPITPPPQQGLRWLQEGWLAEGPGFEVLHLPGHCPGHVAFYSAAAGGVFSGDLLFQGAVGRWDIPSADKETLIGSIRRLALLPEQTVVYPGHGPATTIGAEKAANRYLRRWLDGYS